MNKELLDSMQKQMTPSPEVRAALSEKLAQPMKKRPVPWMKYGAVAACAALVIGAFSVYSLRQRPDEWTIYVSGLNRDSIDFTRVPHHSYVTVEGMTGYVTENAAVENTMTGGGDAGSEGLGDRDVDMTVYDLEEIMLSYGFTEEEVKEYETLGYQMTWAKWWQFVHQQQNSEGDDPFNLSNLKTFSQKELSINTGVLPGGAYVGDIPVQVGAEDYQRLMDHFNGTYPDWYGGAYLDDSGWLVVQLVEDKDPGDKSLELQVLDWAGSDHVMFSSCKYSLAQLKELMDQLNALPGRDMKCRDIMAGWGIDEEANRIELTLTEVNDHILSVLAELDPNDDMILVQVGQRATADVGEAVTTDSATTEDPAVHHAMPGGATVPDVPVPEGDDDLIAVEPWVDDLDGAHYGVWELPEQKQPAAVQSVPEEDVDTMAYTAP